MSHTIMTRQVTLSSRYIHLALLLLFLLHVPWTICETAVLQQQGPVATTQLDAGAKGQSPVVVLPAAVAAHIVGGDQHKQLPTTPSSNKNVIKQTMQTPVQVQKYHIVKMQSTVRFTETLCSAKVHERIQYIFEEGDIRRIVRPLSHKYLFAGGTIQDLQVTSSDVRIKSFKHAINKHNSSDWSVGSTDIIVEFDPLRQRRYMVLIDLRYTVTRGVLMADGTKPESVISWSYPMNMTIDEVYLSVHLPSDTKVTKSVPEGDVFVAPELAVVMKRNLKPQDHYYTQITVSNSEDKFKVWKQCEPKSAHIKKIESQLTVHGDKCVVHVVEKINYRFRSNVTRAYRAIPHQLLGGVNVLNLAVESRTEGVKMRRKATKVQKYGSKAMYISFEFDGLHTGFKDVMFEMMYEMHGALRTKGPHTELHWSYNYTHPVDELKTVFIVPEVRPADDIKAYPSRDATVSTGRIDFVKKDLKARSAYDLYICMPSRVGKWESCTAAKQSKNIGARIVGVVVVLMLILILFGAFVWMVVKRRPGFIFQSRLATRYLKDDYERVQNYQTATA